MTRVEESDGAGGRIAAGRSGRVPVASIDLPAMAAVVAGRLRYEGISARSACDELEISPATMSRVLNNEAPDLRTYVVLCRWLRLSLDTFVKDEDA